VFVYKINLTLENIPFIVNLIQNNPSSIMPFEDIELQAIVDGLNAFILQINIHSPGDGPFLLHIFKNMMYTTNAKANVTNADNFTFSLQTGQLSLNQVTSQIGWGTKRGSCFNADAVEINTMIFSFDMSDFMQNCHASYGKLCGDGVTIYATSQYDKNNALINVKKIPALLLIDEFCSFSAIIPVGMLRLFVAAFQHIPSLMAGTGLVRSQQ